MYCYRGFGLLVHSEFELADLSLSEGIPDVIIRRGQVPRPLPKATRAEAFLINRSSAAFQILNGREIVVDQFPDSDPELVRSFLLGRVMAFLLRQRGWLPLHASGVAINGQAVLFLGPSRRGKSTTAAAFHACGYDVITDDIGAVGQCEGIWLALAAWSLLRLRADSLDILNAFGSGEIQHDKRRFNLHRSDLRERISVKRIFVLEAGKNLSVQPVLPAEGARLLGENSFFTRRSTPHEVMVDHFRACAAAAAALPIYRLFRPQSLEGLPELVRMVEEHLEGT
jgi:hypothetical protein